MLVWISVEVGRGERRLEPRGATTRARRTRRADDTRARSRPQPHPHFTPANASSLRPLASTSRPVLEGQHEDT